MTYIMLGNSDHMWSDSGIRVVAGSRASISAAGVLSLDYCMYFYTEITCVMQHQLFSSF